jgi:hypothetical protein
MVIEKPHGGVAGCGAVVGMGNIFLALMARDSKRSSERKANIHSAAMLAANSQFLCAAAVAICAVIGRMLMTLNCNQSNRLCFIFAKRQAASC